VFELV